MLRNPNARRVDTRAPTIVRNRADHQIEILLPVVNAIFAKYNFAEAWAMNLYSGIVGPETGRTRVAKDYASLTLPQDFAAAGVIGWIKTERFTRRSSSNKRLNDPEGTPGLGTAGFEYQRNLQGNRWNPKRVDAGRIIRQDNTQRLSAWIKTQRASLNLTEATVENLPIDVPGEPVDHITGFREHPVNLRHISARQHVWHTRGC